MVWQGKFQRIYESFSCLTHMKILQNSKINMIFKNNKLIIIKYKIWHCFHHQIEKKKKNSFLSVFSLPVEEPHISIHRWILSPFLFFLFFADLSFFHFHFNLLFFISVYKCLQWLLSVNKLSTVIYYRCMIIH